MTTGHRSIESVLATVRYDEAHLRQLREVFGDADFVHADPDDDARIRAALEYVDVAILAADLDERFLPAPRLRWVHCDHSGLNGSATPEALASDLIVTGSAGRSAPALAQHAFFFALSLAYDAPRLLDMQRAHVWRGIEDFDQRRSLVSKTLGIVGLGSTGLEIAALGHAFGMRVLGYRKSSGVVANVDRLYATDNGDDLDELLGQSDVVVLCIRLTDLTFHLIGERELGLMKPSAHLINLARGPVVDTEALITALRAGRLSGAGLDVFEKEPLPADAEIWDAPGVIITPHVTAEMPDLAARSIEIISENARRYVAGEQMLNQLRPEDVYSQAPIGAHAAPGGTR
jgi:phosphoglycerate dehydrogenase-like enzyme